MTNRRYPGRPPSTEPGNEPRSPIWSHPIRSLYLHVPFCNGKCAYCAFYSERVTVTGVAAWLQALACEAQYLAAHYVCQPETLYIGGGTPSVLSPQAWEELLDMLARTFDLRMCREWTVECNPGTKLTALIPLWRQAGVTRISCGVQSMDDGILKRMRRTHTVADIERTFRQLRDATEWSLGVDLIAAYPGVTPEQWLDTLHGALALAPDHVSVYTCSIEQGTALADQCTQQRLQPSPEALQIETMHTAETLLVDYGLEQYEISNFAIPGHACRHNILGWKGYDYLGSGPAAASRVGRQRWTNPPDVDAYASGAVKGAIPRHAETLAVELDATERLMFAFRYKAPVPLEPYLPPSGTTRTQQSLWQHWRSQLRTLAAAGLVRETSQGWQSTRMGWRHADRIAASLLPDV